MTAQLFTPVELGGVTLPNRIVVSPMCQYSAIDGSAQPWHQVHYGMLAMSGAGLLCLEATHVHWHSHGGPSTVANGLALTPTLHKLFDHGAWSLDDNRRVIVSRHFSGSDVALGELRALEGRPLRAPAPGYAPLDLECIRWHREAELGGVFRN